MATWLRQSTSVDVGIGPFVDQTDGFTAEAALTITQPDVRLKKNGGAWAQKAAAQTLTHEENGNYEVTLDATDTNTLGVLRVHVAEAGALPVWQEYMVVPANVWDSFFAADLLDVSVTQWLGTAAATPTVAGVPEVDVTHWLGTAAATPTVAGVPEVDVTHFGGTAGTFASGVPAASLTSSAINSVADQVWDEALSGHVAVGSAGARVAIIRSGTAQAGAGTSITLDAGASAIDDFYNKQLIQIVAGTGANQARFIDDYVGATKVATVAAWGTNPAADSVFVISPFGAIAGATAPTAAENADAVWDELRADHIGVGSFGQYFATVFRSATAQAGTASTITLDASASATNDLYRYSIISIIGGTGVGQSRQISAYVGSSKVATVGVGWTVAPDGTSVFMITPLGVDAATVASIADGVWDEARAGHATAGTFGEYVLADATRISGDATAADNAESFYDGTGYAGTGNVIPSVTTVTGNVNGNVSGNVTGSVGSVVGNTAQTGDSFARLGAPAGASVSADIAAVKVDTAAILVDTGTTLDGKIDTINTNAASILADTGTDGVVVVAASKTGYALSAAGVDAILDEPVTEPASVFAWGSATLRNIIGWLGARHSNRETQTATTLTLRNRADVASIAAATCSDDATTGVRGSFI